MSKLIFYLQSKIALAIIGMILFGGGAALIASASFSGAANHASGNQSQNTTNISNNGNPTNAPGASTPTTADATPSETPKPGKSPTATPTPRPPRPTPTPTPGIGQATSLSGTVSYVNTASHLFKVRTSSGGTITTRTVTVTSQTTFTGACTSLSGMQTQWKVTIQGAYQADGTFAATAVTSWIDD